jgi:peptidoglycan/LPS O-acetylase OafA/YrhL
MPNPFASSDAVRPAPAEPVPDTETPPRPVRFPCFDGLRAIAALAVFACHSSGWLYYVQRDWTLVVFQSSLARLGYFGVAVFFVISGFLLYRPFVLAHLEGRPTPRARAFWFRRFARVFPAYWVALLGTWLLLGLMAIPTVLDGVMYFALLQTYRSGYKFVGIGVAWTLVIEVSFYAALPAIAYGLRRLSPKDATPEAKLRAQLVGITGLALFSIGVRS